jgi:hypothetical protein
MEKAFTAPIEDIFDDFGQEPMVSSNIAHVCIFKDFSTLVFFFQ